MLNYDQLLLGKMFFNNDSYILIYIFLLVYIFEETDICILFSVFFHFCRIKCILTE